MKATPLPAGARQGPRDPAFTLVELLVGLGVTALLVSFLMQAVTLVTAACERSAGALSAQAQAELILDQVSSDLQAAHFARDGKTWLAATVQRSPQPALGDAGMVDAAWVGLVKPTNADPGSPGSSLGLSPASGDLADFRFGQAGVWLRFFTTQPDTGSSLNNLSAPRAVSYQLTRRRVTASASAATPLSAPVRYLLYRSSARPMSSTWPDVNSTFAVGYDLFGPPLGTGYNVPDSSQIDHVGNIRAPRRYEQILGNNVIDFGVRCWVRDSTGVLVTRFPSTQGTPSGNENRGFAATTSDGILVTPAAAPPVPLGPGAISPGEMTYGFPERIDVFVRILTDEGAERIHAFESGLLQRPPTVSSDAEHWWDLAVRHSRVFTRCVHVHARPL